MNDTRTVRLMVVDDHNLFRRGLIALLSRDERIEVVAEARDAGEALKLGAQHRPDVILLDNPTSGLVPLSTATVEESLYELKQRYTIVMVPHSVQQAARIADRAAFMLDGELIEEGPARQLFVKPLKQRTEDYITGRFG